METYNSDRGEGERGLENRKVDVIGVVMLVLMVVALLVGLYPAEEMEREYSHVRYVEQTIGK